MTAWSCLYLFLQLNSAEIRYRQRDKKQVGAADAFAEQTRQ